MNLNMDTLDAARYYIEATSQTAFRIEAGNPALRLLVAIEQANGKATLEAARQMANEAIAKAGELAQ